VIVREGGAQHRYKQTRARKLKGYSAGRRAYDRRRRATPLDALGRQFKVIVQNDPCALCGKPAPVDADHIDPLKHGGENRWENLGGVCHACNASKGNRKLLMVLHEQKR